MKSVLVFIATVFVVFLFCSFVAADFDFTNWPEHGRFLAACLAALVGVTAASIAG